MLYPSDPTSKSSLFVVLSGIIQNAQIAPPIVSMQACLWGSIVIKMK